MPKPHAKSMICLLGINHRYQVYVSRPSPLLTDKLERFKVFVTAIIQSNAIAAIAEEINHTETIASFIVKNTDSPIKYLVCEPNADERRKLGIPDGDEIFTNFQTRNYETNFETYRDKVIKKYIPVREEFWINCLRNQCDLKKSVLLICGASHVKGFSRRLDKHGLKNTTICDDWLVKDDKEYGSLPIEVAPL